MPLKLYKFDPSPPVRSAMMGCDLFGVPVEMVEINIIQNDHVTPEFLKKNPLHTLPVLEDGDLIIHDSHAILQYLAEAYGKDDSMYPKDLKLRTLVNQKLFFDTAILFPRLRNITFPAAMEGESKVSQKKLDEIIEAYGFLEEFLSHHKYLALDTMTIADVAAYANVSGLIYIQPMDPKKYPKTQAWMKEMQKQPFAKKCNEPGLKIFAELMKKLLELPHEIEADI